MRFFEILTPLATILRLIIPRRWNAPLPLLTVLFQLGFEGYRWQMVPLYAFTLIELGFALWGFQQPARPWSFGARGWKMLGGILILIVCVAPPVLFPIPHIRPPTGPYPVGTLTLDLTDLSRTDPYASDSSALRELMLQVWYPAETPGKTPVPWMEHVEIVAPAISAWIEMPSFFLDHLKYAKTDAFANVTVASAEAQFPVLIFSHGFGGFRAQNTFQMQELASHGYIVVAPEHTYASVITVFPDGRVAQHNPNTLPENVSEAEYDLAAKRLLDQWTADLRFVMDQLVEINASNSTLQGKLDLNRMGVLGHSTGGGATVQVCAVDLRCKAGLGMDAWLVPVADDVIAHGPRQPFLFLYSELWPKPKNMALFEQLFETMGNPVARFTILGTAHYDFTDLPALSPLASYIGLKGPLNGARVQEIIDAYSLAFFDAEFKGIASPLLEGASEAFPEVIFVESK
ncbi:MAG: hypothetical protein H6636_08810 [Anaerolineales bacterium]|nr:hypothetical protein [Anaerolineales bacterium]